MILVEIIVGQNRSITLRVEKLSEINYHPTENYWTHRNIGGHLTIWNAPWVAYSSEKK